MIQVALLRNGSITPFADKNTIISNTCAFDSVAQAIAIGVVDEYALNRIKRKNDDEYYKFINMIIDNDTENVYKLRSDILKKYFEIVYDSDTVYVNCECNVAYIFKKILLDKYTVQR